MECLGFLEDYCRQVNILITNAKAYVEINGVKYDRFFLSRSIRKGCSLALALYIIVADALYYLLRDYSTSSGVDEIKLPNGRNLSNIQFADDTTILTKLKEENLNALCTN